MNLDGVRICPTRDRCALTGDRHDDWMHVDRETDVESPVEAWEERYFHMAALRERGYTP